jgi:branched-chain amino acid transport system permease protein
MSVFSAARRATPLLSLLAVVALVAVGGSLGSVVLQRQTTEVLINVILVVGLYTFVGNTGVLSFGHMSFVSIAAYTGALITIPVARKASLLPELPSFLAQIEVGPVAGALIAGAVALVFAGIIAAPISRVSGLAASLAMFAILVVVYQVTTNWDAVTRGSQTMLGVPTNTTVFSAAAWGMVCIVLAYLYQQSAAGLRARAGRDDEFAARAAGISIARERVFALLLSAFILGVGGFLYAQFQGAFTPSTFFLDLTFLTIAMLIVGGQSSLAGAVLGALVVSIAKFIFDQAESGFQIGSFDLPGRDGLGDAALAALILLILVFRRGGIMNGREIRWPQHTRVKGPPRNA